MNLSTNLAPSGVAPRYLRGTVDYPLTQRMADTIAMHGLAWAVRYYVERLPAAEARLLLVGAYCATTEA